MDTAVGRAGQELGCTDESSERVKVQQQGLRKSKWSSCRNLPRHVGVDTLGARLCTVFYCLVDKIDHDRPALLIFFCER